MADSTKGNEEKARRDEKRARVKKATKTTFPLKKGKHMLLPDPATKEPEPDYPFDDLKENTSCRLHVPIGRSGRTLEATTTIAIPRRTYNKESIPDEYAKVQLQVVHEGPDGVSVLGDAVDLIILWHKNDKSFGLGTDATRKPFWPKPGVPKPPRNSPKKQVNDKADKPEMPKEISVPDVPMESAAPEVPMEISVPDVPMETTVAEQDVQIVASVGTDIEDVAGLEWDGTEIEVFENPSPAKDPGAQEPLVSDKATDKSEVPKVLRSHNSKSKDDKKEKFMVTVFRGGKEHAKLRGDDPQKAAALTGKKYFPTNDCPEKYEYGKALLPEWALDEGRNRGSLGPSRFQSPVIQRISNNLIVCHKQPRGTVLCGYYACEFLSVNGRYRVNTKDLPRIELRTSFDDTGITNVQRDLCHFIHRECCHMRGEFFDPEGALTTSDEFKQLREWNNAMP
uniref:Transposon protein, putative, CACTA, En/Spm sub-class n=1 Tax=Oryza sativa subsp. japonica TaxID=39947 RepID=Q53N27_ORYSJ|nr:hypothetical protein LOC_Os11g16630 [Oryza sativa Japonica Group]